jgi:hypothetical protein
MDSMMKARRAPRCDFAGALLGYHQIAGGGISYVMDTEHE